VVFRAGREGARYEAACVEWDVQAAAGSVEEAAGLVEGALEHGATWQGPVARRYGGEKGLYALMWEGRHSDLAPAGRRGAAGGVRFGLSDLNSWKNYRSIYMENALAARPEEAGGADTIRLIIFRESTRGGDVYVGQCLEYDHGAQGDSIQNVIFRTEMGLLAELGVAGQPPSPTFLRAAPERFEKMWARRKIAVSRVGRPWPEMPARFRLDIALAENT
jgi:hypothetical protein